MSIICPAIRDVRLILIDYLYSMSHCRYLQKPGAKFALGDIRLWAKRPLAGSDVFLVGKAFYNFGGWLQDTILSAQEALQGGWNVKFPWSSSP